jgi:hypothetical protein
MDDDTQYKLNIYKDKCPCNSGKKIVDCCFARINTTPPGHKTNFSHPKCYARSLGDCSKTISKEHYISKGILWLFKANTFHASGFPWLRESKNYVLTKDALSANVLCQRHNEALSGLDDLATKFFRFVLGKEKEQWAMIVPGYEIERWMLKAYCGIVSSGSMTHNGFSLPKKPISIDFLNTLFYRQEIPSGRGLVFSLPKNIQSRPGLISWRPLIHETYGPVGFLIQVEFFNMILSFGMVSDSDNVTEKSKGLRYHPESIGFRDVFGYREVHFGWPGGSHFVLIGKNVI